MRLTGLTRALLVLVLLAAACGEGEDTDAADRAEGAPSAAPDMSEDEPRDSAEADIEPETATELEPLGSETAPPRFPWSETAPPRFPFCWDYRHALERHDASLQTAIAAFMDYTQAEAAARAATDELDRAEAMEVRDGLRSRASEYIGEYASTSGHVREEANAFLSEIESVAEGGVAYRYAPTGQPRTEGEESASQITAPAATEPRTSKEVAYTRALEAFSSVATTEELVLLTNFNDIFNYWTYKYSSEFGSLGNHEWGTALGFFIGAGVADPLPKSPALEAAVAIKPAVDVFVHGTVRLTYGALVGEPPSIEAVPELQDAIDDVKAAARAEDLPVDIVDAMADAVAEAAILDRQQGDYPHHSRDLAIFLYRVVAVESLTRSDAWRAAHQSLIESCQVS